MRVFGLASSRQDGDCESPASRRRDMVPLLAGSPQEGR